MMKRDYWVILSPDFSNDGKLYYYASFPANELPDYYFPDDVIIDHHSVIIEVTFNDTNNNGVFDGFDNFIEREILRFEQPLSESFTFIGSNHNLWTSSF